jgi:hypothetical protein
MSKKSKLDKAIETVDPDKRKLAEEHVPAGYEEQSSDVVGFWQQDGDAIHFIPTECRMMDSSLDKTKTSVLVIGKLVDGVDLVTSDDEDIYGEPGMIVGVWAKPGMAALANLCGQKVYMYLDGYKDTGKASKMAQFAVLSRAKGAALAIARDTRVHSRNTRDPLGLCPVTPKD